MRKVISEHLTVKFETTEENKEGQIRIFKNDKPEHSLVLSIDEMAELGAASERMMERLLEDAARENPVALLNAIFETLTKNAPIAIKL